MAVPIGLRSLRGVLYPFDREIATGGHLSAPLAGLIGRAGWEQGELQLRR
jgi:hypothetical protein